MFRSILGGRFSSHVMSYVLTKSGEFVSCEGDLKCTRVGRITLYSRHLSESEADEMASACEEGKLKEYLNALDKHLFFAIVVDSSDNSVLLLNDKFGSNHLFYAVRDGALFASDDIPSLYKKW